MQEFLIWLFCLGLCILGVWAVIYYHHKSLEALNESADQWVECEIDQEIQQAMSNPDNFQLEHPPSENTPKKSPQRKKREKRYDTRKFTKRDFDYIVAYHAEIQAQNEQLPVERRMLVGEIAVHLNNVLGYNKSRQSYSDVWNGNINRENLED